MENNRVFRIENLAPTVRMGREKLRSPRDSDGGSYASGGTGNRWNGSWTISPMWKQVRQEFAVKWERCGTGSSYFTVGWESYPHM